MTWRELRDTLEAMHGEALERQALICIEPPGGMGYAEWCFVSDLHTQNTESPFLTTETITLGADDE